MQSLLGPKKLAQRWALKKGMTLAAISSPDPPAGDAARPTSAADTALSSQSSNHIVDVTSTASTQNSFGIEDDISRSVQLCADRGPGVHGAVGEGGREEGQQQQEGGEGGRLSEGETSFSSEGSSEASQSLPSFECDSDSLGERGTSSASSSSGYTDSSSDEDGETPTTATPTPAAVILGDRTPSLSEPVIGTPASLSAVFNTSLSSSPAPSLPMQIGSMPDQSRSGDGATAVSEPEYRPIRLFPLVADTPLVATTGPSISGTVDPARAGTSTTPIRSLGAHRLPDASSSSSSSAVAAATALSTPAPPLSSKSPAPGQGWVSPLFGNKAHSSRRFSPYRGSQANVEFEGESGGGDDDDSNNDVLVSAVISQLYPELAHSIGNIVKDGRPSRNASPSLGKIPLGSGVKDASPPQGNAPVVAVATNNSWQRAIEWSKRNRSEQLQQLQRRRSKEQESPTASAVKRELSAQISSQSTNKDKTPREASKRSVSPDLIAASDHHNHILREHERLLQSLQQSLNDVELSVCNKDSPAFMSVSAKRESGGGPTYSLSSSAPRAASAPNPGRRRMQAPQAPSSVQHATPSHSNDRKGNDRNFGSRTAPSVPKRGNAVGLTGKRLSQSAGPSYLRRSTRLNDLQKKVSPRFGSPTRLDLKFKELPRGSSPVKRLNIGDIKEDIYGMDLSALQRFLSPNSSRPGGEAPSAGGSKGAQSTGPPGGGTPPRIEPQAQNSAAPRQVVEDSTLELTTAAEWSRLYDWLRRIEMEKYAQLFRRSGITKLSIVELLRGPDLAEIGVDASDRPHILQGIREFSDRTVVLAEQAMRSQGSSLFNPSSSSASPAASSRGGGPRSFSPALSRSQVLSSLARPEKAAPKLGNDADLKASFSQSTPKRDQVVSASPNSSSKADLLRSTPASGRKFRPTPLKELLAGDAPIDREKVASTDETHSSPSGFDRSAPGASPSAAARLMSHLNKGSNAHPQSLNIISTLLSINRSFRLGDEETFTNAWARVVSSVDRDVGSKESVLAIVNAMQFLEFFCKVYFVLYPQRASLGEDICREARVRFRNYLERVLADAATRTSALVRSREFATYAGIAVIPDARANAAYLPLFADKWSEGLLLRLNAFINGLATPVPKTDLTTPSKKSNPMPYKHASPSAPLKQPATSSPGNNQVAEQQRQQKGGPAEQLRPSVGDIRGETSNVSGRAALL